MESMKDLPLITCFSKRNDSMLMWSHYANGHSGVCIEYERPDNSELFIDVEYSKNKKFVKMKKLTSIFLGNKLIGQDVNLDKYSEAKDFLTPFYTKSLDWEHEKEVRFIVLRSHALANENIQIVDGVYYLKLRPKRIYLWCNAVNVRGYKSLIKLAKRKNIEIVQMKVSYNQYAIVPNEED